MFEEYNQADTKSYSEEYDNVFGDLDGFFLDEDYKPGERGIEPQKIEEPVQTKTKKTKNKEKEKKETKKKKKGKYDDLDENKIVHRRSLILRFFSRELRKELLKIVYDTTLTTGTKNNLIEEALTNHNVEYSPLGSGTNRMAVIIDNYAVKIALDEAGMTDNKREFKYTAKLQPYVIKVYEVDELGLLAVTERVNRFTMQDLRMNTVYMREILEVLQRDYFIGDVGSVDKNYSNWGFRTGAGSKKNEMVILDFAYTYDMDKYKEILTCDKKECGSHSYLVYDVNYHMLTCPNCGTKYAFTDVRRKWTKARETEELKDYIDNSYKLLAAENDIKIDYEAEPGMTIEEREAEKERLKRKKHSKSYIYKKNVKKCKREKKMRKKYSW